MRYDEYGALTPRHLIVIILVPLTLVSMVAGYWRVTSAAATAREIFDLNLQALTLTISNVVVSGGDVISDKTRQLLQGQFGANLFYHVYGPDGVFVTGYASPPVTPGEIEVKDNVPVFFRSVYRGEPVRVSRLREQANFEGVSGFTSVTVWQSLAQREEFVERLASRLLQSSCPFPDRCRSNLVWDQVGIETSFRSASRHRCAPRTILAK